MAEIWRSWKDGATAMIVLAVTISLTCLMSALGGYLLYLPAQMIFTLDEDNWLQVFLGVGILLFEPFYIKSVLKAVSDMPRD
jgi:hypothetical protein